MRPTVAATPAGGREASLSLENVWTRTWTCRSLCSGIYTSELKLNVAVENENDAGRVFVRFVNCHVRTLLYYCRSTGPGVEKKIKNKNTV